MLRRRRRRRIVLLCILLAVLSVLLFIPVPGGLLKGKIRKAVRQELGLNVSFRDAWVTVASGTVDLEGVDLQDPENPQSNFHIGQLEVSGPVEGLLLKSQPWPTTVRIEDTSSIRAALAKRGPELVGPLADILKRIQTTRQTRQTERGKESSKQRPFAPPSVRLLNTTFLLDGMTTGTPLLSLNLQSALFYPGPEGSNDYELAFTGLLATATPARATGSLRYHAAERFWEANFATEALGGSVPVDGNHQRLWWHVKNLQASSRISASNTGKGISISLTASSPEVELANGENGNRPLFSGPLNLALDAVKAANATTWTLHTARVSGPDINVVLGGQIDTRAPHSFTADLGITRLPGRVYHLARQELAEQQATFDFPTSAGLRLTAHLSGRADQLTSTTVTGHIDLDTVRFRHPLLPQALTLEQISGRLTARGAELDIARWKLGDAGGSASAELVGLPIFGHTARLSARFRVNGSAEELVRLGRSIHLLPPQVERFESNIRGEANLQTDLSYRHGRLVALDPDWSAQLSWVDGKLALTDWQDTIRMETGALKISPRELDVLRLHTNGGGVDIRWNGTVRGGPEFWVKPRLKLAAEGETTIPALARLMDFEGLGITAFQNVHGKLRVDLNWNGPLSAPDRAVWKAAVRARDVSFPLPLRGDTAKVHGLDFDAEFTTRTVNVDHVQGNIDDISVEGKLRADEKTIHLDAKLQASVETVLRLFRQDLAEFRGHGIVPATVSAGLETRDPLPSPNLPLVLRWAQALSRPGAISTKGNPPIRPTLEATLYPDGASFWHEEMPETVTNIRGRITADLTGLRIHHVLSQWGDVTDCLVDGRVVLGSFPIKVFFNLDAPRVALMPWFDGWGHPPDGRQARGIYKDKNPSEPPKFMTMLQGTIRAKEVTLNRLHGTNGSADLHYENWHNRNNSLDVQNINVSGYDGTASGSVQLTLEGREIPARFNMTGQFTDMKTQPFLTDLFGREEKTVGRLHGYLRIGGQFKNPASFVGEGSVLLRNTQVLGGPIFPLLGKILKATVVNDITFSNIRGAYRIRDSKVTFERLFLDSPGLRLFAIGTVSFLGDLNMEVSVGFYSETLNKIPGVSFLSTLFRQIGSSFLKFDVKGTLTDPKLSAVPFSADVVEKALSGSKEKVGSRMAPVPTPTPRPPFSLESSE